jgi:ADP-L-glycero-D-manno-heptose 6-epimerase
MNKNTNFNKKTILITADIGFIGNDLIFDFQEKFPKSKVFIFDYLRNDDTFQNRNLKSFNHYKKLIGSRGAAICKKISFIVINYSYNAESSS